MAGWSEIAALVRLGVALLRQWLGHLWCKVVSLHSLKLTYTGPRMHRVRRKAAGWGDLHRSSHHPLTKPDWVRSVIIDLHTALPRAGCRSLANQFNTVHADFGFSVSKTWGS
ncbi:MAG: hypothetical protein HC765_06265 [Brachymonas sp.]|nr:hypothetical protein [Brachymonas sp.]